MPKAQGRVAASVAQAAELRGWVKTVLKPRGPVFMPSVSEAELPRTEVEMYEETEDERPGDVQGDSGILCSATGLCPLS